jgi:hypothetical protein
MRSPPRSRLASLRPDLAGAHVRLTSRDYSRAVRRLASAVLLVVVLYGGDGNDVIRARDGSFDVVGCGPGRDAVIADRVDLVGVDCERVTRR